MKSPYVNYNNIADSFERERTLSNEKEKIWQEVFGRTLSLSDNSHLLDIGCGSGRFSILIRKYFNCRVTGIDPSLEMMMKAKSKCPSELELVRGRGENLPFSTNVFDVCLASQVVQHFQNKPLAFSELCRVLRTGGRVGIRISSHSQLHTILDYRFFPSAFDIERNRLPDVIDIRQMLAGLHIKNINEYIVSQPLFESADEYISKLKNRYASFLFLISEDEYQRGLREATDYVKNSLLEKDRYAEITFLVGTKQ